MNNKELHLAKTLSAAIVDASGKIAEQKESDDSATPVQDESGLCMNEKTETEENLTPVIVSGTQNNVAFSIENLTIEQSGPVESDTTDTPQNSKRLLMYCCLTIPIVILVSVIISQVVNSHYKKMPIAPDVAEVSVVEETQPVVTEKTVEPEMKIHFMPGCGKRVVLSEG